MNRIQGLTEGNISSLSWWLPGQMLLAATPIGNLGDASARLIEAFEAADLIAAEDTRRTGLLRQRLGVKAKAPLLSCHEHNESRRSEEIIAALQAEKRVLVVTDAGMPLVSDPGYVLVQAAISAGITVSVLPGPSAVLSALALSGLPSDRFCFEGFLPRGEQAKKRYLAELAGEKRTMVFFEAPGRIAKTLSDLAAAFGMGREACLCRELTKAYEEVWRGTLAELLLQAENPVKGEIVLVVAGKANGKAVGKVDGMAEGQPSWEESVSQVVALQASGMKMKAGTI